MNKYIFTLKHNTSGEIKELTITADFQSLAVRLYFQKFKKDYQDYSMAGIRKASDEGVG